MLPSMHTAGTISFYVANTILVSRGRERGGVVDVPDFRDVVEVPPCVQTVKHHNDFVLYCRYNHDGSMFAAASHDNTISIWNNKSANKTHICELKGHGGPVYCCVWSHDGGLLASCSHDTTLR